MVRRETRVRALAKAELHGSMPAVACTQQLAIGTFDPVRTQATLLIAGHPPPVIRRDRQGAALLVTCKTGPPLGVHANVRYETATIDLQPGDSVTFYTDGLIERRGRNLDEGIQQLRNILTSTPNDQSVHDLCDAIADSCFPEEQPTDDICVLVARRPRTTQAGMSNVR